MATIHATSCSYAHVIAAIAAASAGDTVAVPAGTATWASQLVVTKGVSIIGAGMYSTYVTSGYDAGLPGNSQDPSNPLILYQPDATARATNAFFRFSGFNLDLANRCGIFMAYNPTTTKMNRVRFDNCYATRKTVKGIYTNGMIGGVCDSCVFDVSGIIFGGFGLNDASWSNFAFYFGNEWTMYNEDNIVTLGDTVSDGGAGALVSIRHNTFNFTKTTGSIAPAFDMHGNDPAAVTSGMVMEVYENVMNSAGAQVNGVDLRGGKGLYYNNNVIGGTHKSTVQDEHPDSDNPPATDVDGNPQHINTSYWFGNKQNSAYLYETNMPIVTSTVDYGGGHVVPTVDKEFFRHKASFDGSSGVGVGLLAARPASCTLEGAGYWATDESKLYRWHSGAWELFYTPYTYPHPLRATTGGTFTLSIVPVSQTKSKGTDAAYTVTVNAGVGFTDDVTLGVSGLPAGVTPVFDDNPLGPDASTTLTIPTSALSRGTYNLAVTGQVISP